jgi:hypothetical protein
MSTDSVPPTSPRGVLFSLIAEDRPWTVEEMICEKGEGSRLAVVDSGSRPTVHYSGTRSVHTQGPRSYLTEGVHEHRLSRAGCSVRAGARRDGAPRRER